jgi:hypothetical protein
MTPSICRRCRRPYGLRSCRPSPNVYAQGEEEFDWLSEEERGLPCGDCGVERGGTHHAFCDMAFCKAHGLQLLMMACACTETKAGRVAVP